MASVAEQFVEIATMTISNYSKKLANNVLKSNALFGKMYEKKRMVTGGKDLQFSIKYKENSGIKSFSGYDKLDITRRNSLQKPNTTGRFITRQSFFRTKK